MPLLSASLYTYFARLPEPRRRQVRKHSLLNILFISLCALLSGADTFTDIARWAVNHQEWLQERIEIKHGLPSHDTGEIAPQFSRFGRVFALLDTAAFSEYFNGWTKVLTTPPATEEHKQVCLDGKTIKASFDTATGQKAIHLVRAFASEQRIVLDQETVNEKSNEITAIPALLSRLDLTGCLVSADAMGCQKKIAEQIIEQKGEYLLSLKENHRSLYKRACENIADWQEKAWHIPFSISRSQTVEKYRGSVETRRCYLMESADFLDTQKHWRGLYGVALVKREICRGKSKTISKRLYLTILRDATKVLQGSRRHWGIENEVHWVLDVVFLEDTCRVRKDNAGVNLSILRQVCSSVLRRETDSGLSLRAKRKEASWNVNYLETLLTPKEPSRSLCD